MITPNQLNKYAEELLELFQLSGEFVSSPDGTQMSGFVHDGRKIDISMSIETEGVAYKDSPSIVGIITNAIPAGISLEGVRYSSGVGFRSPIIQGRITPYNGVLYIGTDIENSCTEYCLGVDLIRHIELNRINEVLFNNGEKMSLVLKLLILNGSIKIPSWKNALIDRRDTLDEYDLWPGIIFDFTSGFRTELDIIYKGINKDWKLDWKQIKIE